MRTVALYWCQECGSAFINAGSRLIKPYMGDARFPKDKESWEGPFFDCPLCKKAVLYGAEDVLCDNDR